MLKLWQEPFLIIGGFIVFEIIRRFDSKNRTSYKKSLLNIVIPTVIVIVISFLGDTLLN